MSILYVPETRSKLPSPARSLTTSPVPVPACGWECKIVNNSRPNDAVIVNPSKVGAPVGSILCVRSLKESENYIYTKVTETGELKNAGIGIDNDFLNISTMQPMEDVSVQIVEKSKCILRMVEVTMADQYLSRGDMWRLKSSFHDTCTYIRKRMEFSGITVQVLAMYDRNGKEMKSGYIDSKTHFTYRSLSSFTQIFIQLGKEMWDNDSEGEENWENFEKVVYQFIKTLFEKWKNSKANHDLQLMFFCRIFFPEDRFPESKADIIQFDMQNRPYLDIYDIICTGGNLTDLKPIMSDMKRRFNKLGIIIKRLSETHNAELSSSSRGNFLECINLALVQYSNHFMDRVHYRTGQQIMVITAGSGVFYVKRDLASFTKHKVLDLGVGTDVVCLGPKPLHATPLFVYNRIKVQDKFFDKYQVPHWINTHFYTNKVEKDQFVPLAGIQYEDYRNNPILTPYKGPSHALDTIPKLKTMDNKQLERRCDDYDSDLINSTPLSTPDVQGFINHDDLPNSLSSDGEVHSTSKQEIDPRKRSTHGTMSETNPFRPSDLPRPNTNNRRRWAHIFPSAKNPQRTWNGLSKVDQNTHYYWELKTWHGLSRSLRIEQDPSAESMDWQSLISPACFPITTDYYPESHYMKSDKHYKNNFWDFSSESVEELRQELTIQRLSRGYQMVLRKDQSNLYCFSVGDIYHELKLQDTDGVGGTIHVTVDVPERKSKDPGSYEYQYCLIPLLGHLSDIDTSLLKCKTEMMAREKLIGNWNRFDGYMLELHTRAPEDEEEADDRPEIQFLIPWKSRYAILPRPDQHPPTALNYEQTLLNSFYNVLFSLNNMKGQDFEASQIDAKRLSIPMISNTAQSAPNSPSFPGGGEEHVSRPRTHTLVDSKSFSFSQPTPSNPVHSAFSSASSIEEEPPKSEEKETTKVFKKFFRAKPSSTEAQDFKEFRDSIIAPNSQMKFLTNSSHSKQPNLPEHSFLSCSLIDWLIRHQHMKSRPDAIDFGQKLLDNKVIEETIPKESPLFIDGFYFYHLKPEKPSFSEKNKPKILFEVTTMDYVNFYVEDSFQPVVKTSITIQSNQKVDVSRKEFFFVTYDSCFDKNHAYGITIMWDKATAQLIENNYIKIWRNKAEKNGFQLIQVPINPFDSPECKAENSGAPLPFRAPLDIEVATGNEKLIKKMLFDFGFLHDYPACKSSELDDIRHKLHDYIHISGIIFVRVVCKDENSAILKWACNSLIASRKQPKLFFYDHKEEVKFNQTSYSVLYDKFLSFIKDYNFDDIDLSL